MSTLGRILRVRQIFFRQKFTLFFFGQTCIAICRGVKEESVLLFQCCRCFEIDSLLQLNGFATAWQDESLKVLSKIFELSFFLLHRSLTGKKIDELSMRLKSNHRQYRERKSERVCVRERERVSECVCAYLFERDIENETERVERARKRREERQSVSVI